MVGAKCILATAGCLSNRRMVNELELVATGNLAKKPELELEIERRICLERCDI